MSLVRGAVGLAKALTGVGTVPVVVERQRRKVCDACPDRRARRCGLCGCLVAAKCKVRGEVCPAARWRR